MKRDAIERYHCLSFDLSAIEILQGYSPQRRGESRSRRNCNRGDSASFLSYSLEVGLKLVIPITQMWHYIALIPWRISFVH